MHRSRVNRIARAAALLAAVACVSGCGSERQAEVETGTAEVEVSTTLPKTALSDAQLEAAAANAAALASAATNSQIPQATNATPAGPP